jgi:hypothetical protein
MVEAGLPDSCSLLSSTSKEDRRLTAEVPNSTSSTCTPKKQQTESLAEVLTVTANNELELNERKIEYMDSEQGQKECDSDQKERDLQMQLVESKVRIEESMVRISETKVCIGDVKYDKFWIPVKVWIRLPLSIIVYAINTFNNWVLMVSHHCRRLSR